MIQNIFKIQKQKRKLLLSDKISDSDTNTSTLFHTDFNTSVQHQKAWPKSWGVKLMSVVNWVVFGLELRGVWCGTEGFVELMAFFVWNWEILEAEKKWPFCVELICWTGVWNWGVFNWGVSRVELRGFWCRTEKCVKLRGFWCGTDRFWVLTLYDSGASF